MIGRVAHRLARRIRTGLARRAPRAVILHYHHVARLAADPYGLCVTPAHFDEHLQVVRRLGHPVTLPELVRSLRNGSVPRRAVVVTFDDGYIDNLAEAKPLLEKHGVPATVFVTTGAIGSQREFWWDEIEQLLLESGELPPVLRLRLRGEEKVWVLGGATRCTDEDRELLRGWRTEQPPPPGSRQHIFASVYMSLHPLDASEKRDAMDRLFAWAGARPSVRPTHRAMTAEELVQLTRDGLIDAGSHTVSHPPLAEVPIAEQRDELQQSKARLEAILDRPVSSFAYPHGSLTAETVDAVRAAGYSCACAMDYQPVRRGADLFRLPREWVRDWTGDEFAAQWEPWFRA